ncbi:MAG TPA: hypothetical protein VNR61_00675, partial [Niallia sp.]|nr:hypothetical protein [Niallia sp.]
KVVKEVPGKFGIWCLDLCHYGLYPISDVVKTIFFSNADRLYRNNEGRKVIARRIEDFIKSLWDQVV